jgi:hypothetical protein
MEYKRLNEWTDEHINMCLSIKHDDGLDACTYLQDLKKRVANNEVVVYQVTHNDKKALIWYGISPITNHVWVEGLKGDSLKFVDWAIITGFKIAYAGNYNGLSFQTVRKGLVIYTQKHYPQFNIKQYGQTYEIYTK